MPLLFLYRLKSFLRNHLLFLLFFRACKCESFHAQTFPINLMYLMLITMRNVFLWNFLQEHSNRQFSFICIKNLDSCMYNGEDFWISFLKSWLSLWYSDVFETNELNLREIYEWDYSVCMRSTSFQKQK